ncbi:ead/Ea22-like family protein [Serratia sp. IR-2025]
MDNKLSELKAAAMAATPGPWILDDDSWSDGDHANISTEERYDSGIINIAQVDGGGSESGFDEPFSIEQQANARFIAAANPAVILALLAELEAKDKRIAELERANTSQDDHINQQQDRIDSLEKTNAGLGRRLGDAEKRLATPVQLPNKNDAEFWFGSTFQVAKFDRAVERAIRAAGFKIEGED